MVMKLMSVVGIWCLAFGVSTAQAEEGAKRIAVVNVSRVFNAYQKVKDVQDKMGNLFDPDRKAIEKDGLDLKRRQDELQVEPGDPKRDLNLFKRIQQFELDKMTLDIRFQKLAQQVEEARKNEMKTVLNDIKTAIRVVGSAEKFDLVLRAPEFEDEFDPAKAAIKDKEKEKEEPQSAADLVRKFRENPVLFFSTGVDVTQKVIDKLNDDYKKAGGK